MEKKNVAYICAVCQTDYLRWQGQCDTCQAWNTLEEISFASKRKVPFFSLSPVLEKPVAITTLSLPQQQWLSSGFSEVDRVLWEGFTTGGVYLLGGEPGIGKSTLSLQIAQRVALKHQKVLYISAEESVSQLYLRSKRLGQNSEQLLILMQSDIQAISQVIDQEKPAFVIIDSIQVLVDSDMPSASGSVNQVRNCTQRLIQKAKSLNTVIVIIGHITKDGQLAGPKALEHLVDAVLYFEGERHQQYRLLRCFKNRFASTQEIGIFKMVQTGLEEVKQPSELFIDETTLQNPGSIIVPVLEGSRAILVEVQSLVVDTGFGMAKRNMLGVDVHRATLMMAAIEKLLSIKLSGKDIFLNIVGGFKIKEPPLDLGIVLSILSCFYDQPLPPKTGAVGEVGLTGELRPVPYIERRLMELQNMGFESCLLPAKNKGFSAKKITIKLHFFDQIQDVIRWFLKGDTSWTKTK